MDILKPPPLPEEMEYLWQLYVEIRKGCVTVSYQDLSAYQQVTGVKLSPFESDTLLSIDLARNQNG